MTSQWSDPFGRVRPEMTFPLIPPRGRPCCLEPAESWDTRKWAGVQNSQAVQEWGYQLRPGRELTALWSG